jgi:hypothetical protein
MSPEEKQQQDRALDALIVLALRGDPSGRWGKRPEPDLSAEERQVLESALGPNFLARLRHWARRRWPDHGRRTQAKPRYGLTGSFHRAGNRSELTDEAREEMERKVRELEAEAQGKGPEQEGSQREEEKP